MRRLVLASLLLLAACGGPRVPEFSAPSPRTLELFGVPGEPQDSQFQFRNEGGATRYQVTSPAPWLAVASGGSGTLSQGERALVGLRATCPAVGLHQTTVRFGSGEAHALPVSLRCDALPAPAGGFEITLLLGPGVAQRHQPVFRAAAARWAQVVTGDLPSQPLSKPANFCGLGEPAYSGVVDDLVIYADIVPLDGPGRVLAQAGPCLLRQGGGLPAYGVMRFDRADVDALGAQFEDVVLHEMGHVLGVGPLWNPLGLLDYDGPNCLQSPSPPTFTGADTVAQWERLGGAGGVPVEDNGVAGTGCSHWKETVFGSELMTGFLDRDRPNPISRVSVASLADLGYAVNLGAAQPYALPTPGSDLLPLALPAHEEILPPVGVVQPDGSVVTIPWGRSALGNEVRESSVFRCRSSVVSCQSSAISHQLLAIGC